MPLPGQQARGGIKTDPTRPRQKHLAPRVQVGEINLGSRRPVDGLEVGLELDKIAAHKPSGKAKPLATEISRADCWLANLFGFLPLLALLWLMQDAIGIWQVTLAYLCLLAGAIGAGWIWWLRLLKRKLGGYTGDTLGAIQQISEIMFYLASLAWLQFLDAYY